MWPIQRRKREESEWGLWCEKPEQAHCYHVNVADTFHFQKKLS